MEDEDRSVIISIKKPRIFAKASDASIKTFTKRCKLKSSKAICKPSEVSLQKYSLPESRPLETKKVKNELLLLPYKLFSQKQKSHLHKTRLGITIIDKYKICSTDLRRRRHVEHPADDTRGMTDIDPKFYTCINGRPIKSSIPLFKSILPLFNNLFRMKHEVSIRNDCILQMEANMRTEIKAYEKTVKRCKNQVLRFDTFILHDYQRSMAFLNQWDDLTNQINLKSIELQHLANDKFAIMSRLIGLDYRYSVQQKYGRFLHYLSPPSWRAQHNEFARSIEIEEKGFDFGNSYDDPLVEMFENLNKEECQNRVMPALYFNSPSDLIRVFEGIEQQQLHYLTYVTYSTPYANRLKKGVKALKTIMQQNSYSVVKSIDDFQNILESCFVRCNYLEKKFNKILYGTFYDCVGSLDVMQIKLQLEYCFEKVIGETPINMSLSAVALALESCYMDYTYRLETINSDDIKGAAVRLIELERHKMKRAKVAARELRMFERLQKELQRVCLPPPKITPEQQPLDASVPLPLTQPRSRLKLVKGPRAKAASQAARKSLTEADVEYLTLFTDWTEGDDPRAYLQDLGMRNQSRMEGNG